MKIVIHCALKGALVITVVYQMTEKLAFCFKLENQAVIRLSSTGR